MTATTQRTRCGTLLGFYDHRDSNEDPCSDCVKAEKEWWWPPKRYCCGTVAGYHRHYRRGEKCGRCLSAYRDYTRKRRRNGGVVQSPRTQSNILDLLEMFGPMTTPRIVDEMALRNIGTFWSVRRAVYRLRDKGLVERVGTATGGPFGTTEISVWGLTDEGVEW